MLLLLISLLLISVNTVDAKNLRNIRNPNSSYDNNENGIVGIPQQDASQVRLTICQNRCANNCIEYINPANRCFNAKELYPEENGTIWSDFDVFDLVQIHPEEEENSNADSVNSLDKRKRRMEVEFVRYFFNTTDSSCETDSSGLVDVSKSFDHDVLPLDECISSFGTTNPWGYFHHEKKKWNPSISSATLLNTATN